MLPFVVDLSLRITLAAALVPRPAGIEVVVVRLGRAHRRELTEAINAAARGVGGVG